jgi:hypothetical protein
MRYCLIAAVVCVVFVGCQNTESPKNPKNGTNGGTSHSHEDGSEHEHKEVASGDSHVHADGTTCTCELGENGGHLLTFENKEYKAEYVVSKESDVVRFFLLNSKNEDVSLKVDSFQVIPLAGAESEPFMLKADHPDAEGKSHVFMAEEKDLRIAISLGVKVKIKAGDLALNGTIEAHETHDH